MFHDRFPDLREEVRETLSQQQSSAEVRERQREGEIQVYVVPWLQDGESGTPSVEERVRLLLTEQQTVSQLT